MNKKEIIKGMLVYWLLSFVCFYAIWNGMNFAMGTEVPFSFPLASLASLAVSVGVIWIRIYKIDIKNQLDKLEIKNQALEKRLKKSLLTTEDYGKIVFNNLAACVEILSNHSNEVLVAKITNDITVCLPTPVTCIIRNNKIFMDMDIDFGYCHNEDIAGTMLLEDICEILDRQEYFARMVTNRMYSFGDETNKETCEIVDSQESFARNVCGEMEYFEKDTFRLYLTEKINLPGGIVADVDAEGRRYVIGTLGDFIRWIVGSNLKENSKEET